MEEKRSSLRMVWFCVRRERGREVYLRLKGDKRTAKMKDFDETKRRKMENKFNKIEKF